MKLLVQCLAIGGGGFLGSIARFLVGVACGRWSAAFPVGTFIINISGSLFLGWFLTVVGSRITVSDTTKFAVATGFVGAYTTFSTFMWESNALLREGSEIKAMVNLIGSLIVGLLAVKIGMYLARG
jgi:CrcB protein